MQEPDPEWYKELIKEGEAPEPSEAIPRDTKTDNEPAATSQTYQPPEGKPLKDFTKIFPATCDGDLANEEYGVVVGARGKVGRLFFTEQVHDITPPALGISEHLPKYGRYESNPRAESDDGTTDTKFRLQGATGRLWDGPMYGNTWVSVAVDGTLLPGDEVTTFLGSNARYRLTASSAAPTNAYSFQYATYTVKDGLADGVADTEGITYAGSFFYGGEVLKAAPATGTDGAAAGTDGAAAGTDGAAAGTGASEAEAEDDSFGTNLLKIVKYAPTTLDKLEEVVGLKRTNMDVSMSSALISDPSQRPEDQYFMKQDPSTLWAYRETAENGIYTLSKKYSDRLLTTFRMAIDGDTAKAMKDETALQAGYIIKRGDKIFSGTAELELDESSYVLIDARLQGVVEDTH